MKSKLKTSHYDWRIDAYLNQWPAEHWPVNGEITATAIRAATASRKVERALRHLTRYQHWLLLVVHSYVSPYRHVKYHTIQRHAREQRVTIARALRLFRAHY